MYLNFRVSGFNGILTGNFKLNKATEPLHGPNCVRKWRRKLLLLGLLGFITIIWFFVGFNDGTLGMREKTPDMSEGKARILQQHFNVSKDQLLALASLFSESDQVLYS